MSNPQSLATHPCFQTSTGMEGAQNTPSIPIPFYIKNCSACRHPELRETSYARNPLRGIQQRLSNKSAANPASLRSAAPSKGRGEIDHLIPSHQPLVTSHQNSKIPNKNGTVSTKRFRFFYFTISKNSFLSALSVLKAPEDASVRVFVPGFLMPRAMTSSACVTRRMISRMSVPMRSCS